MKKIIIHLLIVIFLSNSCKTKAEKTEEFCLSVSKELYLYNHGNPKKTKEKIAGIVFQSFNPKSYFVEYKNASESSNWSIDHHFNDSILNSIQNSKFYEIDEFKYNIYAIHDYWYDYFYYNNRQQNFTVIKFEIYSVNNSRKYVNEDGIDINDYEKNENLVIYILN